MSVADDLERTKVRFAMTLHPVRQRAIMIGLFAALAVGFLVMLAMLVFGMWLDLTVPLPVGLRRVMLGLTALSASASVIALLWHAKRHTTDHAMAGQIDEAVGADGRVMAGFDLVDRGIPSASRSVTNDHDAAVCLSLAALAADQATQVCQNIDPVDVVSSQKAKYWWRNAAIAVLGVAIIAAFVPRMAWTQAQRMLIPMESQLPYSPTTLLVEPGDTEVLFGSDLEVFATIQGPTVDDLELVMTFDDQTEETLPLLAETDVRWRTYLTRVTRPANYFVKADGARSEMHRIDVRMTPEIKSVRCVITPPQYTKQSPYEGPIPDHGFQGLVGTKVEIELTSNRPLKHGTLSLEFQDKKESVELQVDSGESSDNSTESLQTVRGGFTLSQNGHFHLSLTDIDGTASNDFIEGAITLLTDQKPVIRLLQPKAISLATPNIPLPIVIAAEDDFGLTRLELFRGLNQSPEIAAPIELEDDSANLKISTSLPLSAYGLEPGDEITIFARVEDNDPAGAKGAESPVATVRIISPQQLAELELSRRGMEAVLSKQRQAQRQMEQLQEQLNEAKKKLEEALEAQQAADQSNKAGSPDASEKQSAADQAMQEAAKQLASAQKSMEETADAMRQSAAMELPVDIDKGMNEQLSEMADKLQKMAQRMSELQEKMESGQKLSAEEQEELKDLMQQLDEMKQQHQDSAMNPTERMSKILPLAADQQRFTQLARRQRSLADRLDALQSSDLSSPETKRRADELRREEQQLQVALSQLLEDIESHVKQLPDDPELDKLRQTATDFVDDVRASQADPAMTETQKELLGDQPVPASQQATKAAEILESFLSQCDSMGGQACKNCEASFNPSAGGAKPGNSISQLLKQMGLGEGQSGMKPGPGMGMAPGDGYSMPQNTPDNIGVYGGLPIQESKPSRGNGPQTDGGVATYDQGGTANGTSGGNAAAADAAARGDSGAVVPGVYQKQVSDYFRGLAEELGDQ
ncbi:MAG: hypothetical protein KDB00_17085 [Planctomycetales bacterium]|nr:hypothetical protein [Planctomycetales bacterium]